jgi:hypothetical protein
MRTCRGTPVSLATLVLALVAASCGSTDHATPDAGPLDAHPPSADGGPCASDAGGEALVALQITNVNDSCMLTINGDVSVDGDLTLCQKPGTITLSATASTGFTLGSAPWHDTTTANGSSATVVLTSGAKCIWVCCPGDGKSESCPTVDQCP